MKTIMTLAFTLFTLYGLHSQSLAPVAIGSGYVNGSSNNAQISSTVGQTVAGSKTDGTSLLTEGVHQPTITITEVEDNEPNVSLSIFPNPNTGAFSIQIEEESLKSYKGQLFSITGTMIQEIIISGQKVEIDISQMPSGSYFLHVLNEEGVSLKQYKVIKMI